MSGTRATLRVRARRTNERASSLAGVHAKVVHSFPRQSRRLNGVCGRGRALALHRLYPHESDTADTESAAVRRQCNYRTNLIPKGETWGGRLTTNLMAIWPSYFLGEFYHLLAMLFVNIYLRAEKLSASN